MHWLHCSEFEVLRLRIRSVKTSNAKPRKALEAFLGSCISNTKSKWTSKLCSKSSLSSRLRMRSQKLNSKLEFEDLLTNSKIFIWFNFKALSISLSPISNSKNIFRIRRVFQKKFWLEKLFVLFFYRHIFGFSKYKHMFLVFS